MKRIVVLALCLCMVLPMVFVMALGAGASEAATPVLSTDKSSYFRGDAIKLSVEGTTTGWVGIVPADADGEPITDYGGLYWKYVRDLDDTSITTGTAMKANNVSALAGELGLADGAALLAIPAGNYFAFYVSDENKGLPDAVKAGDVIYTPFTVMNKFVTDKTVYTYGEAINVTPLTGSGTDWIGISPVSDDGTINRSTRYIYIDTAENGKGIGVANDIREGTVNGADAEPIKRLPAGRYVLYFVPNNGAFGSRDKSSEIYIDILGATVEKTEFKYGEPIMVTGYGSGKDWIGISQYDAGTESGYWSNGSIRWRYITHIGGNAATDGFGSGVAFDIREAKLTAAAASRGDLPVGEYVIFVGLDDCYAVDVSPYTEIRITITAEKPDAPTAVKYELDDDRTGLAGGKLTVTFAESAMEMYKKPTRVELYWGDENGNALAGYGKIGDRKITGAVTEIGLTDSMVIPAGAKKLMVRAYNGAGYATEAVAAEVPEHSYRATGDKVTSFQIVSDVHISERDGAKDLHDSHAAKMFADIKSIDPDTVGIFVAGDIADTGSAAEFERFFALWQASGLAGKPYIGIGNHEMYKPYHTYDQANYAELSGQFIAYKNSMLETAEQTSTSYYYVNRGGQHFIFLATEYCGTHAYLSDAQLTWLEDKLQEVASDGAPVFILLHQGLYNSVAGTLGNAEGTVKQGWDGVIAGDANMQAWRELAGNNLSDHGKMKGQYEQPLRDILKQYPSAMMFSGHSHWIMESMGNIHEATAAQPNYMFNTASVAYLWTDHDQINGGEGTAEGSQGYYVTVYENCIEFRGRDFVNGEWIPSAYYRVWLECAHEYDHDCATACKWCGETRTDAPAAHVQDAVCTDDECNVCGEQVTLQPHEGEKACSETCKHCGTDIEHEAHVGDKACSTVCKYGCGTAVEPAAAHETEHDCDAVCKNCGAAVTPAAHEGAAACATTCKYGCGTAVTATAAHETDHDCDAVCKNCNEAVEHEAHVGDKACSTVCKYGCGTAVEPAADHAPETPCTDTVCPVCNEAIEPVAHAGLQACATVCQWCDGAAEPTAEHTVEFRCRDEICTVCNETLVPVAHSGAACATVCQYGCGTALTPTAEHTVNIPCTDTACAACGEAVTPVQHEAAAPCATTCKYGCNTLMEATAEHDQEFACSETCKNCGAYFAHVAHEGKKACSTVCKYGCGTAVIPTENHVGLHDCSVVCKICGESRTPDSAHVTHVACRDTACAECGEAVTPVAHAGQYACSTVCRYGCGTAVEAISEHDYGDWEVTVKPTATQEGEQERKCSICGKTDKEAIEATGIVNKPGDDKNEGDDIVEAEDNSGIVIAIVVGSVVVVGGGAAAVVSLKNKKAKKEDE